MTHPLEEKVFQPIIGKLVIAANTQREADIWLTELQQYEAARPSSYTFHNAITLDFNKDGGSPFAQAGSLAVSAFHAAGLTRCGAIPINYSVGILTVVTKTESGALVFETVAVYYDGWGYHYNNVPGQQVRLTADEAQQYELDPSALVLPTPAEKILKEQATGMYQMCLINSGQLGLGY
jgi:hypothetical protein